MVIRGDRPVELNVDEILRANTAQLLATLRAELELSGRGTAGRHPSEDARADFHREPIYKAIEKCETYEAVQGAVLKGVSKYREQLRRDVSAEDVEMLLGLRIKRISLFDIAQNQREIDALVAGLAEAERQLKGLTKHAINYLRNILKTYGKLYPRLTRTGFLKRPTRASTRKEPCHRLRPREGLSGFGVKGEGIEPAFRCSELDRILIVSGTGDTR